MQVELGEEQWGMDAALGVAWVRLELGRESGRGVGVSAVHSLEAERNMMPAEKGREAGEGGLLSKGPRCP